MRTGKLFFYSVYLVLFFAVTKNYINAQSIWTNPIVNSNPSSFNPFILGDVADPNITVSGISRGSGINPNAGANRYNATAWNLSVLDAGDYFQWTLTPNAGYSISFNSLTFLAQVSSTGPINFVVRSSMDGYVTDIANPSIPNNAVETGPYVVDLTAAPFQNLTSSVSFRIYGYGGSGASGTFSINDFTFNGTVNPDCLAPTLSESHTNITCNGANNGSIDLSTSGGTGPFNFAWTGPVVFGIN